MDKTLIDPFKPATDEELEDELAALDWEPPTTVVPEIAVVLFGLDEEVDLLMRAFDLDK
jgi:hypothetical protein